MLLQLTESLAKMAFSSEDFVRVYISIRTSGKRERACAYSRVSEQFFCGVLNEVFEPAPDLLLELCRRLVLGRNGTFHTCLLLIQNLTRNDLELVSIATLSPLVCGTGMFCT